MLVLLTIINIVFSPAVTEGMAICHVWHLIIDHHMLLKELYPHQKLIPKHHFMIHYPRIMRKIGPMFHFWSMRFEAKHRFFKNTIKNFKNITKSLALKHQMAIAYHWESMPLKSTDHGPVKTVKISDLRNGDMIADSLHVDMNHEVDVASWVTCYGTEYRPALLVCSKTEDGMPVFSQIKDIVVSVGECFLAVQNFETLGCAEHFHSYQVFEGNGSDTSLLKVEEL